MEVATRWPPRDVCGGPPLLCCVWVVGAFVLVELNTRLRLLGKFVHTEEKRKSPFV